MAIEVQKKKTKNQTNQSHSSVLAKTKKVKLQSRMAKMA